MKRNFATHLHILYLFLSISQRNNSLYIHCMASISLVLVEESFLHPDIFSAYFLCDAIRFSEEKRISFPTGIWVSRKYVCNITCDHKPMPKRKTKHYAFVECSCKNKFRSKMKKKTTHKHNSIHRTHRIWVTL